MNKLIVTLLAGVILVGCVEDENIDSDTVVYSDTLPEDVRVWCKSGKLHYGGLSIDDKPLQPVLIGTKESPRTVTCKEK